MSLNEESSSVPYRLGRLFAALEKTQNDTNREMKSTINSKYFSSASSTPAVVFPVLLKLAQHHIAKSEWGFRSNQLIEQILDGVDEFPAYLNLEDQGMFMVAPFAGVWIEITKCSGDIEYKVAPFAGVWIEMTSHTKQSCPLFSLPE